MPSSDYSIGIVSLGCAKNLVDTEYMCALLKDAGYRFTADMACADVLLVNTCAFIEDARRESIDAVLEVAAMKQTGACRFLVVCGCLSQRYAGELPESLPEVDVFLGVDQLDEVVRVLDNWRDHGSGQKPECVSAPITMPAPKRLFEPPMQRQTLTGGPYAYIKIAEGCNHRCAFCAIPAIRGRRRSRGVKEIRAEVETLLAAGILEFNLVAQDTTAYGRDLAGNISLSVLLRELGAIGGDFWIRLLYGFPSLIDDRLLNTIAGIEQVCNYLDVPIQHSHPDVLRFMGRAGTVSAVNRLAARSREIMPDVTLRTTCLVGHPGETPAAFQHLRRYLDAIDFDHLGVFVFSPEEGTRSARAASSVPVATARRRRDRLMLEQQQRVARRHQELAGKTDRILIETSGKGTDAGHCVGRSRRQAPQVDGITRVIDRHGRHPETGKFVNVVYTKARQYDLDAEIV